MKYRNFPFGYRMENGKIRINEKEAEILQLIFRKYIGGTALKKIADYLTLCKTEYMPQESRWNKSRVKRVIEDSRYTENEKYPQIIDKETFLTANEIKEQRRTNKECVITAENRAIACSVRCGICGERMLHTTNRRKKHSEQWKCSDTNCGFSANIALQTVIESILQLLNILIQNLDDILTVESDEVSDIAELKDQELYTEIEYGHTDKKQLKKEIFECALKKYENITGTEYITERIKADLKKEGLLSDLSVELFEKIISYTIIEHNGTVSIVLKNGNRIERNDKDDNGYGIRRKNSNGYSDKT